MTNLTEQLQAKTEEFKRAVEEAKNANAEKLEQSLAEAKSKATQKKAELEEKAEAGKSEFQAHFEDLKSKIEAKKADIREKIDETKKEHQIKKAEWQAEDAEENAKELMALSFYYIDAAQIAVMEAVAARIKAEAMKA
jgi:hypothetical protein